MPKKTNVQKKKKETKPKKEKAKPAVKEKATVKEKAEPVREVRRRAAVDIDISIYGQPIKFLEEKISTECFLGVHDQCFGQKDCECECHKK